MQTASNTKIAGAYRSPVVAKNVYDFEFWYEDEDEEGLAGPEAKERVRKIKQEFVEKKLSELNDEQRQVRMQERTKEGSTNEGGEAEGGGEKP